MSKLRTLSACLVSILLATFTSPLPAVPSPSLSLIQDSPDLELLKVPNLLLPTYLASFHPRIIADDENSSSDTFPIPKTDMTLRLHQFGPFLNPTDLKFFFLETSNDVQHRIDSRRGSAASSKPWYNYTSDHGLVLEIWSRFVPLEECCNLGGLRDIVNGLSLYMIRERPCRAVQFLVVQNLGAPKAVVMNTGSIRQDIPSSTTKSKRDTPPSPSIRYSSSLTFAAPVNASVLSLSTADNFPIPHTDYSLGFGNLGSHMYSWDLENILIAVSADIEEQVVAHGRNARLASTEYSKNLAGLQLWIHSMPWATVNLAWAELAVIVGGLWLYFVDGGHDQEAFYDVINHVTGTQVALGWIGKPYRPLESTSSIGAGRRSLESLASRQNF